MATLFIADLHLSEHEPAIAAGFLRFLRTDARRAEALYILGDLFDAWIGDDDPSPLHDSVAGALLTLRRQGVACYFIHGNRDFLLGRRFAERCGMTLLPEEQALDLYGRRVVILHGDTLCSDDLAYQRYRRRVHNPLIQRLFLALPLRLRLRIAARMRASSSAANQRKSAQIMDVNPQQVEQCLRRHRAQWMIHGHTHRPAIHEVSVDGRLARRAVLGAWHREGWQIRVTPEGMELLSFPY